MSGRFGGRTVGARLFYHHRPVRVLGAGPMGLWLEDLDWTHERYLVPSPGPTNGCLKSMPEIYGPECGRCGWRQPNIIKLEGPNA